MSQNKLTVEDVLRHDIEVLQNQQQQIVSKFDNINKEIESTVADYNAKITQLQKDGQLKVDQLDNEREQLRGAYSTLTQIINEKQKQLDECLGDIGASLSQEDTKSKKEKVSKKETTKLVEPKQDNLTPEQIKAVEDITNNQPDTNLNNLVQSNQSTKNDIPEYLQDEYNKLK